MLVDADQTRKRRGEVIDKLAATLILQSALDRFAARLSRSSNSSRTCRCSEVSQCHRPLS